MDESGVSSSVDTGGSSDTGFTSSEPASPAPSVSSSDTVSTPSDASVGADASGGDSDEVSGAPATSDGDSVADSEESSVAPSDSELVGAIGDLVEAIQGSVTDSTETAGDVSVDAPADGEGNELPVYDADWFTQLYGELATDSVDEGLQLESIETFALSPIESSTGLKGLMLEIIGPYDNIVTQYKYQSNTSSNYTYVNEVTPDYPWIASAVLFVALVISIFSLVRKALWTL